MSEKSKSKFDIKILMGAIIVLAIDIFLVLRLIKPDIEMTETIIIAVLLVVINLAVLLILRSRSIKKKKYAKALEVQSEDNDLVNEAKELVFEDYGPLTDDYEEKVLDLTRPNLIRSNDLVYKKQIDLVKYCDDLSKYLIDHGISIDKNIIRELFSCINASKIVVINGDEAISERFIELVSEFIGSKLYTDVVRSDLRVFNDLFRDSYQFKDLVNSSSTNPDVMHFMVYKNVELENLENYFETLMNYSLNPKIPTVIDHSYYKKPVTLFENIWFMLIKKDSQKDFNSALLANSTVQLNINAKLVEPAIEVEQNSKLLSFVNFNNMSKKGYEEIHLSEDNWKKLDKIDGFIKQYTNKLLDNKQFRQLERYTSTFLLFGGDEFVAIDRAIVAKLVNLIKLVNFKKKIDVSENIFDVFQSSLGLENLEKSKTILKKLIEQNQW